MSARLHSALVFGLTLFTAAAAHATTVSGTASFADNTNNNDLSVVGTFNGSSCSTNCSFSESVSVGGASYTSSDFLTVYTNLTGSGDQTKTDDIEVSFDITSPASGSGSTSGTGTETQTYFLFYGYYDSGSITWNAPATIALSDGDTLTISLANATLSSTGDCDCGSYDTCANVAATFTLTDPVSAATPEPGSFALLGTGLASVAGIVRRKRGV